MIAAPLPKSRICQSDAIAFLRELKSDSIDLIVTDPAYSGMNQHLKLGRGRIVGEYKNKGANGGKWFAEFHDDPDNFRIFLQECRRVLKDGRHIYIMFDSFSLLSLAPIVREVFAVKNIIVWDKINIGMGHHFRRQHELILFAAKGKKSRKLNSRALPDIWRIKRIHQAQYPTEKPINLFGRMIAASADRGDVVCDPFVGSGSSAVAAAFAGCGFVGCDISELAIRTTRERLHLKEALDACK